MGKDSCELIFQTGGTSRSPPLHHADSPAKIPVKQGVTHDNPSTNYFLSCRLERKVGSAARNGSNLMAKVCEMAATAPAVLPPLPRRPAYCSAVTDVKVHRGLALALATTAARFHAQSRGLTPLCRPLFPHKVGVLSEDSPLTHNDEKSRNIPRAPFPNSWRIRPPEFGRTGHSFLRSDRPGASGSQLSPPPAAAPAAPYRSEPAGPHEQVPGTIRPPSRESLNKPDVTTFA